MKETTGYQNLRPYGSRGFWTKMIVSAIEYQGINSAQPHSEKLQNKQNAPMVI